MTEEYRMQVHESTHHRDEMQSSNTHCKATCNSHGQLLHLSAFEWCSDRLLCYIQSINQTNQSALLLWFCSQTFKAKMAYVQPYHNSALCVSITDILIELANNSNQFRNDIKSIVINYMTLRAIWFVIYFKTPSQSILTEWTGTETCICCTVCICTEFTVVFL